MLSSAGREHLAKVATCRATTNCLANFRRAVVKVWKPDVKWGFLTDNQSGNDVFLHVQELPNSYEPQARDHVVYRIGIKHGRVRARDVTVV
jgi:cold shock CspA family protein